MSKPVLSIGFDVPFTEAIAWAKNRVSVLPDTYYNQLPAQARSRAFTVSGLSALDQIQGVLDSLHQATESGETFAQWKKSLKPEVLALGNARLDNIFRTGVQTHYNIGRYEQQEANKAHRPYRMWDAINDGRTRPAHKAMDNFIAPIDDPIWRKWSAPAGFRCRCSTLSLTEAQAKQRGYKVGNQPPVGAEPDKGWDYDKRTGQDAALKKIVADKLAKCEAFDFAGKPESEKVWCKGEARKFAESLLVPDNGGMKKISKAVLNQPTWKDKGLSDLRTLANRAEAAPKLLEGAESYEGAITALRLNLGIQSGGNVVIETPIEKVKINDESLPHVVEKRSDQRERFAPLILPTLERPTEIWAVEYDDGTTRNRYLKLFSGVKYDLLIMVKVMPDGSVFWNMMQRDRKGMNSLRIGSKLY